MNRYAIIVAGGKGTRMNSEVPKQFLLIDGVPIIVWTIRAFLEADSKIRPIIVLPKSHLKDWFQIKEKFLKGYDIDHSIGGETRTASVMSGLSKAGKDGLVAIHDAVRPYVSIEVIMKSYDSAEKYGSGVACVPLKDSIRELKTASSSQARNRDKFVLVQTPQTFDLREIKDAYQKITNKSTHTDDASVYEQAGYTVRLVEGSYSNIKITTPDDLKEPNTRPR